MTERKRRILAVITVLLLASAFVIVGYALGIIQYRVKDNLFDTGVIDIDIYGGNPDGSIIGTNEFLFEPGMTVVKPFYVENHSSDPGGVYYRLYFQKDTIKGELADVLDITIKDGDTVLLSGKMNDLTRRTVMDGALLAPEEKKELTMVFHFPEGAGNDTQDTTLEFALSVVAVQSKNNPDKDFGG